MNKISLLVSTTMAGCLTLAMNSTGAAGTSEMPGMSSNNASSSGQLTQEQQQKFGELSNNSDRISKEQAKADTALSKDFKHYDTNHDGYIDQSEFAAFEASQGNSGSSSQSNP